jgi:CHAT domain-containing protein/tetratricopeptide (TPR) repeat protein
VLPSIEPGPGTSSRRWAVALAGLGVVVAGLAETPPWPGRTAVPSSPRAELLAALAPARPLQGRLVGGFAYAPLHAGGWYLPAAKRPHWLLLARLLAARVWTEDPADAAADRALLRVIAGDLPSAAAGLEAASQRSPADARLANDLAAVQLALAASSGDPHRAVLALLAAEQAHRAQPDLTEAAFNRALALEAVGIDWEARSAWQDYLVREPHSGWADEARAHLRSLISPPAAPLREPQHDRLDAAALAGDGAQVRELIAANPQAAREYVEQVLLGRWAERLEHGRLPAAERALDTARAVGAALQAARGDAMAADAVAAIDAARREANPQRLRSLAAGHAAYQGALAAGFDLKRARALWLAAERRLAAGGSPFRAWAALQSAIGDFHRSRYRSALSALQRLERGDGDRYPCLLARVLRVKGLTFAVLADYSRALPTFADGARLYRRVGEIGNLISVLAQLATTQQYLGRQEEAWRTRCEALRLGRRLTSLPIALLIQITLDAVSQGEPQIALYFQDEGLRLAELAGDPAALAEYLRTRAAIHFRLGRADLARKDLVRALANVERIPFGSERRGVRGDLLAIAGEVESRDDPRRAAALFSQAIAIYRDTAYRHYLAQLHRARAAAWLAAGDLDAAEADYRVAIALREGQRAMVPDEQWRAAFFDQVQSVFEEMAFFQLTVRARADRAFDYAERARGRTLLDLIARSRALAAHRDGGVVVGTRPLDAAAIRGALPTGTVVVAYSLLETRTLAWSVRRESLDGMVLPAGRDRLCRLVESARGEMVGAGAASPAGTAAAALFEILVAPMIASLPPGSRLTIVADGCLALVPYAALRDPATGRYLIEDHVLAVAPSATAFVRALARDRRLGHRAGESVLIVGDPTVPGLESLPGARREAAALRLLYGASSRSLGGSQATRQAVLAALPACDVAHLANHALIDADSPLRSRLVFAAEPAAGDSGELSMGELFGRSLPRTRLIVLAACASGAGKPSNSEGPLSLARPFLADDVPAVVAALWSVDDEAAADLFLDFHRRVHGGQDAAGALRAAQVAMLHSADPRRRQPAAWAAFEMFGGVQPRDPERPGGG